MACGLPARRRRCAGSSSASSPRTRKTATPRPATLAGTSPASLATGLVQEARSQGDACGPVPRTSAHGVCSPGLCARARRARPQSPPQRHLAPGQRSRPRFRALTFGEEAMGGARFRQDQMVIYTAPVWQGDPMQRLHPRAPTAPEASAMQLPSADLLGLSAAGKMAISTVAATARGRRGLARGRSAWRELLWRGARPLRPLQRPHGHLPRGQARVPAPGKVLYDAGPDKDLGLAALLTRRPLDRVRRVVGRARRRSAGWTSPARNERSSDGWDTTMSLAWHPRTGEVWFSAREFASFGVGQSSRGHAVRGATAWWPGSPAAAHPGHRPRRPRASARG